MNRCPRCQRRVAAGSAFCAGCGAPTGGERGRAVAPDVAVELLDGLGAGPAHELVLGRSGAGRGRWWAGVAGLVAVAIVAASVAFGNGGGGGARDTVATSTVARALVAATTTSTTVAVAGGGTTTTESDPATTTAPTEPTTTVAPGPVSIGRAPLLGEPSGLLLYLSVGGHLFRVDLDAATAAAMDPDVYVGGDFLWASTRGPVVTGTDGALLIVREGGATPVRAGAPDGLSTIAPVYLGEGPAGRLWYFTQTTQLDATVWFRDGDGEAQRLEPTVSLTADFPTVDGIGGVLVTVAGGIYRLVPGQAPRRVGTGTLVDVRNGHTLERTCDEALRCRMLLRDLRNGRTSPAPVDDAVLQRSQGGQVSSDGRWVLVTIDDLANPALPDERLVAYGPDGATLDLGALANGGCLSRYCPEAPAWSSDGRWVFGQRASGTLWAWRPGLASPVEVSLQGVEVQGYSLAVNAGVAAVAAAPVPSP